jgi:hypothetical protein
MLGSKRTSTSAVSCLICLVTLATSFSAHARALRIEGSGSLWGNEPITTPFSLSGFFGAPLDFGGTALNDMYISDRGIVTFGAALSGDDPFASGQAFLAPYYASTAAGPASGAEIKQFATPLVAPFELNNQNGLRIRWLWNNGADEYVDTQIFIIDRADRGSGQFDFVFNYGIDRPDQDPNPTGVDWENGAVVGWSNGGSQSFNFRGDLFDPSFSYVDMGGSTPCNDPADAGLICFTNAADFIGQGDPVFDAYHNSLPDDLGFYYFQVGQATALREPASGALVLLGFGLILIATRRYPVTRL